MNNGIMRRMEQLIGEDEPVTPFVPQVDPIPPVVEKFLNTAQRQYQLTHNNLVRSAELLEAKAAELRRRADQVMVDLNAMTNTIKSAVKYEEECRHTAQSFSLVQLKEGE